MTDTTKKDSRRRIVRMLLSAFVGAAIGVVCQYLPPIAQEFCRAAAKVAAVLVGG